MQVQNSRELLAERLMEEAEHSSEAAIRAAFSRAYYALYHFGRAITGKKNHQQILGSLRERDTWLADEYEHFLILRQWSDYDPDFAIRQYGEFKQMQIGFKEDIARARDLFERLREELRRDDKS